MQSRKDSKKFGEQLSSMIGQFTLNSSNKDSLIAPVSNMESTVEEWTRTSAAIADWEGFTPLGTKSHSTRENIVKESNLEISGSGISSPRKIGTPVMNSRTASSSAKIQNHEDQNTRDILRSKKFVLLILKLSFLIFQVNRSNYFQIPKISHLNKTDHENFPKTESNPLKTITKHKIAVVRNSEKIKQDIQISEITQKNPIPSKVLIDSSTLQSLPINEPNPHSMRFQSNHEFFSRAATGRLPTQPSLLSTRHSNVDLSVLLVGKKVGSDNPPCKRTAVKVSKPLKFQSKALAENPLGIISEDLESNEFEIYEEEEEEEETEFLNLQSVPSEPTNLEPFIVDDGMTDSISEPEILTPQEFPFKNIDEVDDIIKKYTLIINDRARRLNITTESEMVNESKEQINIIADAQSDSINPIFQNQNDENLDIVENQFPSVIVDNSDKVDTEAQESEIIFKQSNFLFKEEMERKDIGFIDEDSVAAWDDKESEILLSAKKTNQDAEIDDFILNSKFKESKNYVQKKSTEIASPDLYKAILLNSKNWNRPEYPSKTTYTTHTKLEYDPNIPEKPQFTADSDEVWNEG
ncbi:hypothetical protein HK096_005965 [Nowakowskiella sp. JEL0078]|nr:hypothetical protein HK096_005965 [Nowakowskiella sp. JEL0078]